MFLIGCLCLGYAVFVFVSAIADGTGLWNGGGSNTSTCHLNHLRQLQCGTSGGVHTAKNGTVWLTHIHRGVMQQRNIVVMDSQTNKSLVEAILHTDVPTPGFPMGAPAHTRKNEVTQCC